MGLSYLPLLLSPHPYEQDALLRLLLLATSHPDPSIAGYALPFWYELAKEGGREGGRGVGERHGAVLQELLGVLIEKMVYPEEAGTEGRVDGGQGGGWDKEEKEDFEDFRFKL
eukprot:evm.model.NODE_15457_length_3196_cov_13.889236.1